MTDRIPMSPPMNDEAEEDKLIALSMRQAQRQLEKGTASSQIVTHFLRLGSKRADIELKKLELESRLIEAKIESEQQGQQLNKMFQEALIALKGYRSPREEIHDFDI